MVRDEWSFTMNRVFSSSAAHPLPGIVRAGVPEVGLICAVEMPRMNSSLRADELPEG
jgi:hypothetical protein